MTGAELNEMLNDIFSLTENNKGFFDDPDLASQHKDTYAEYDHDDLLCMLIENYDENKQKTWLSIDNKDGCEGYYCEIDPCEPEKELIFEKLLENSVF